MRSICTCCKRRVNNYKIIFICSLCNNTYHNKCQTLTRNDVKDLTGLGHMRHWTCKQCTSDIFPLQNDNVQDQLNTAKTGREGQR